jgi:hypothetical protein
VGAALSTLQSGDTFRLVVPGPYPQDFDEPALPHFAGSIQQWMKKGDKQQDTNMAKEMSRANTAIATIVHTAVVADGHDMESVATAHVLTMYVRKATTDLLFAPGFMPRTDGVLPPTVTSCIFVLSNGALQNSEFVQVALYVEKMQLKSLPVISDDSFRFPNAALLREVAESSRAWPLCEAPPLHVACVIASLFKEIAIVFCPQEYSSTHELLSVKADTIAQRISSGILRPLAVVDETVKLMEADFAKLPIGDRSPRPSEFGLAVEYTEPHLREYSATETIMVV